MATSDEKDDEDIDLQQNTSEEQIDDDEVAALLASLKQRLSEPETTNQSRSAHEQANKVDASSKRKRSRTEMEEEATIIPTTATSSRHKSSRTRQKLIDPRLVKHKKSNSPKHKQMNNAKFKEEKETEKEEGELCEEEKCNAVSPTTKRKAIDPFWLTDWSNTDHLFLRITYFNKRKCRRFPRNLDKFEIFQQFIEFHFPSLTHSKWHIEADQDWIEDVSDFNAVRDLHLCCDTTTPSQFFLELMIINESLPIKHVYAPKAVYLENPYKCNYPPLLPPVSDHSEQHKSQSLLPYNPYTAASDHHPFYAHPPPLHHPAIAPPTLYPPPQPQVPIAAAAAPAFIPPPTASVPAASASSSSLTSTTSIDPVATAVSTEDHHQSASGGYHHVTYPQYAPKPRASAPVQPSASAPMIQQRVMNDGQDMHVMNNGGGKAPQLVGSEGAVCPDPTTYLPFSHAGQSTPQMRTLHKIVWVLQHQSKPLTVDTIRKCLPGKKKAQIQEIDYLLTSYESYNYTKSIKVHGRKMWELCPAAFPPEFWNMQWQRP